MQLATRAWLTLAVFWQIFQVTCSRVVVTCNDLREEAIATKTLSVSPLFCSALSKQTLKGQNKRIMEQETN